MSLEPQSYHEVSDDAEDKDRENPFSNQINHYL